MASDMTDFDKRDIPLKFKTQEEREAWLVEHFIPKDVQQQLLAAKESLKDKKINIVTGLDSSVRVIFDVHITIPFLVCLKTDSNEWIQSVIDRVRPMVEIKLYQSLAIDRKSYDAFNVVFRITLKTVSSYDEEEGFLVWSAFASPW